MSTSNFVFHFVPHPLDPPEYYLPENDFRSFSPPTMTQEAGVSYASFLRSTQQPLGEIYRPDPTRRYHGNFLKSGLDQESSLPGPCPQGTWSTFGSPTSLTTPSIKSGYCTEDILRITYRGIQAYCRDPLADLDCIWPYSGTRVLHPVRMPSVPLRRFPIVEETPEGDREATMEGLASPSPSSVYYTPPTSPAPTCSESNIISENSAARVGSGRILGFHSWDEFWASVREEIGGQKECSKRRGKRRRRRWGGSQRQ